MVEVLDNAWQRAIGGKIAGENSEYKYKYVVLHDVRNSQSKMVTVSSTSLSDVI